MTIAIVLYDQLLFRPMVAWADKFRAEQTAAQTVPRSWVLDLFRRSSLLTRRHRADRSMGCIGRRGRGSYCPGTFVQPTRWSRAPPRRRTSLWLGARLRRHRLCRRGSSCGMPAVALVGRSADRREQRRADAAARRVLVALASLIWVPIGVAVGLRPRLTAKGPARCAVSGGLSGQPLFPGGRLFDRAVRPRTRRSGSCPLMILGTQWYILFNVIAGASAFPSDLREAAASFRVRPWRWWREVMLPGIFPYYVTGAITASGGAWNASIVSEVGQLGTDEAERRRPRRLYRADDRGRRLSRVSRSASPSCRCSSSPSNRLLWRPLYAFAERRTRLD